MDQIGHRQAETGHDRAEMMAGSAPADMASFQHGNAGAESCGFQRYRQPGEARADNGDVDIKVE